MKLVTGIEAIQSGKPWKDRLGTEWIEPNCTTRTFTPKYLMEKEFIIKEEPREFWIYLSPENGAAIAYHADYAGADFKNDRWIRVREIEK